MMPSHPNEVELKFRKSFQSYLTSMGLKVENYSVKVAFALIVTPVPGFI